MGRRRLSVSLENPEEARRGGEAARLLRIRLGNGAGYPELGRAINVMQGSPGDAMRCFARAEERPLASWGASFARIPGLRNEEASARQRRCSVRSAVKISK